jgi:hypothetical protein
MILDGLHITAVVNQILDLCRPVLSINPFDFIWFFILFTLSHGVQ